MPVPPKITAAAWVEAVMRGETMLGYDDWKKEQLEAKPEPEDDGPVLRCYGVRLWATFRAMTETDVEAFSFESAVEKAKGITHSGFTYEIESMEGDETLIVYGPSNDDPNDDDPWAGDGVEIDKRDDGEPFSWEACQLVKDIAAMKDKAFESRDVVELINKAVKLCAKDDQNG